MNKFFHYFYLACIGIMQMLVAMIFAIVFMSIPIAMIVIAVILATRFLEANP